jgi:2-dehydropantoate 2-reductase
MRVAIVGAGALGSLIGHAFCRAGRRVTLVDRPDRLSRIAALGGLVVTDPEGHGSTAVPELLTPRTDEAGQHDVVFLATKSQDLPAIAGSLSPLLGPDSFCVTVQNGIPWWYFQGLDHRLAGRRLASVDPDGLLERRVDASRIVGCIAYPAAILRSDGTVSHVEGHRFPVGEIDGRERVRTRQLMGLFVDAGFKSRVLTDIRSEIWLKALGALSINPISALTRASMADICTFEPTRALVAEMMREAREIAESLGASFRHTIEERIEGARAVGAHKTSMMQDVENGRPMELDALMLSILELAELTGHKADAIRNVYACAALLNKTVAARAC